MNILLDTNAVIYFLKGVEKMKDIIKEAEQVSISFITEIELLSGNINNEEKDTINNFLSLVKVIYPSRDTVLFAASYKKEINLKIPDAIICAEAKRNNLTLITADEQLIKKVNEINIVNPLD